MIKSLIVLFGLSSGSRLLLQNQNGPISFDPLPPAHVEPQVQPPAVGPPVDPQIPSPYVPFEPLPPAAVVPVAPGVPINPAAPTQPVDPRYVPIPGNPQTPPQTIPVNPSQPGQPVIPPNVSPQTPQPPQAPQLPQLQQIAPPKLECKFSPPSPLSCAGQIQTITNPTENFEVICAGVQGCAGMVLNIDFTAQMNPHMDSFKGLWFVEQNAAASAVIVFNNQRPGDKIMIEEVTCDKQGACFNTQFIIGTMMELEKGNFFCAPGACDGCVVKESIVDPGVSCYAYTEYGI